jgi:hypothetical protein
MPAAPLLENPTNMGYSYPECGLIKDGQIASISCYYGVRMSRLAVAATPYATARDGVLHRQAR